MWNHKYCQFSRHYKGQPLNTHFIFGSDNNIIIMYSFKKGKKCHIGSGINEPKYESTVKPPEHKEN